MLNPAIAGFNPGQSADTLYVTNGETTDYADSAAGTVAFTPELGEGAPGAGFVFPDDEALIQAEFERMLAFHLGLARSAADPDDPVSPVGITVKPFYLDQDEIDPQNGARSRCSTSSSTSHTAIRRRSGCSPSAASARSGSCTRSTAGRR